jgi:hypothetical protein
MLCGMFLNTIGRHLASLPERFLAEMRCLVCNAEAGSSLSTGPKESDNGAFRSIRTACNDLTGINFTIERGIADTVRFELVGSIGCFG